MTDVTLAPAPWRLEGRGLVVAVRLPEDVRRSFLPQGLELAKVGGLSYLMLVDYAGGDVGPYHELLFIPGRVRFGDERRLSITRIFVSSEASVVNGRRNWGIPKDRCDFDVSYDAAGGGGRAALKRADGSVFAEIAYDARGPRLPAPGGLVPAAFRTLAQERDGVRFTYAPSASGHFRFARVREWRFDAREFPDLARGSVVAAACITDFRMIFPVARLTSSTPGHTEHTETAKA